jgi:hypothetical protein
LVETAVLKPCELELNELLNLLQPLPLLLLLVLLLPHCRVFAAHSEPPQQVLLLMLLLRGPFRVSGLWHHHYP